MLTDDGVGALFEVLVRAGLGRGLQGLDVHHEALVVLVKGREKIFRQRSNSLKFYSTYSPPQSQLGSTTAAATAPPPPPHLFGINIPFSTHFFAQFSRLFSS